jgi:hypothetical protein
MIETVSKVMWIGRMTRLPVVRRLILLLSLVLPGRTEPTTAPKPPEPL